MELDKINFKSSDQNRRHYEIFRESMQFLLLWGQCWGMIPVHGITETNPLNIRFRKSSFRFGFSIFTFFFQALFSCMFIFILACSSNNLGNVVLFFFYLSNCLVTLSSIQTALKWPTLAKEVSSSNLDVNPWLKKKCMLTIVMFFGVAFFEYIVALIGDISYVLDCLEYDGDVFGRYIQRRFAFLFSLGVPYHITLGIFLQYLAVGCMVTWNYSDLFIICISFYLTSVLEEINKKLQAASKKSLPSHAWRDLREAYTRATRLVRLFDDAINHVTFVTFGSTLFFVWLKLYFVLSYGINGRTDENCPNFPSGPFNGYEKSIYFLVSLLAVLFRALSVPLIAAEVNAASKAALTDLYRISTKDYCDEVQRLIEQIHGDTVTLTGFNLFSMTRELILTVAGSIITYELVLLQFKGKNQFIRSENDTYVPFIMHSGHIILNGTL